MLHQWSTALTKHKLVMGVDANEAIRPSLRHYPSGLRHFGFQLLGVY